MKPIEEMCDACKANTSLCGDDCGNCKSEHAQKGGILEGEKLGLKKGEEPNAEK